MQSLREGIRSVSLGVAPDEGQPEGLNARTVLGTRGVATNKQRGTRHVVSCRVRCSGQRSPRGVLEVDLDTGLQAQLPLLRVIRNSEESSVS